MRSVLVGFGRIANSIRHDRKISSKFEYASHAQVLNDHPAFDWVGVVDPSPEARKDAAEWGVSHIAPTVTPEMEPEFAVLAVPPGARLEILKQMPGLKAVLVEKPLGTDGQEFLDYCDEHGIRAYVNFWRRGVPAFQALSKNLKIGSVQAVFCTYGNGLYNNGSHLVDFVRMLFGSPVNVQTVGLPAKLDALGCSGPVDDWHASFVLDMGQFQIFCAALDYNNYREFGFDIWGTDGRMQIIQESLVTLIHPRLQHRSMERQMEIASDIHGRDEVDVSKAFYNVYSMIADDTLPRADMVTENILRAVAGDS